MVATGRAGIGLRIAGTVVLGAWFALALASGLDRASADHPRLARLVPARFAATSLGVRAEAAHAAADLPTLSMLSRQLVDKEPLEPASTALLGAARVASGDAEGGDRAFRVAGQLGWRIPLTQIYWMARAIEVGDMRVAAQRLDAVLRAQPEFLANQQFVDLLETSAAGREALRDRLALQPDWLDSYIGQQGNLSLVPRRALLQRAEVVTGLPVHGLTLGCTRLAPFAQVLLGAGAVGEASAVWRAHCRADAGGLVADGDFARADLTQTNVPFGWQFPGDSDIDLSWQAPVGSARQLVVTTTATVAKPVARQLLVAPPGRYRLRWHAQSDAARPAQALVAISCQPAPDKWLSAGAASGQAEADVTIDSACPVPWLILGARALHAGTGGEVRLASVRLEQVR